MREFWIKRSYNGDGEEIWKWYDVRVDGYNIHLVDYKSYEDACYDLQRHMAALDIAKQFFFRALGGVTSSKAEIAKIYEAISKELKK